MPRPQTDTPPVVNTQAQIWTLFGTKHTVQAWLPMHGVAVTAAQETVYRNATISYSRNNQVSA